MHSVRFKDRLVIKEEYFEDEVGLVVLWAAADKCTEL